MLFECVRAVSMSMGNDMVRIGRRFKRGNRHCKVIGTDRDLGYKVAVAGSPQPKTGSIGVIQFWSGAQIDRCL